MDAKVEERVAFVDWIRVIACFMVMLVHASENFYGADDSGLAGNVSKLANEANRFWVAFYDGGIGRTAVPLFMTISAFLLIPLKPGMSMAEFYRKGYFPASVISNETMVDDNFYAGTSAITFGVPTRYDPDTNPTEEKERLCAYLRGEMLRMAGLKENEA